MRDHDESGHDLARRYARLAAGVLASPRQREPEAPAPAVRDAAIAALASAIATRPGRVVRRRVVVALGAAAVAVVALAVFQLGGGSRVTVRLTDGPLLPAGTVVRADAERPASLTLSTGTRLQLSERGRIRLVEVGPRQQFALEAGRVSAQVSPLARNHRFLIGTPDAEIEVRGTSFEIALAAEPSPCGGGITQVKVSEGLVTVRRGEQMWQVSAGRTWPDACPPAPPPHPSDVTASESIDGSPAIATGRPRPSRARPRGAGERQRDRAATSSNLREQNELFAAAMDARRRGDVAAARRALDELLARFPFGVLAESARADLALLRASSGSVADAPR